MIRASLAAAALLFGAGPGPAPLVAPVAISPDDAALLRTILAELGPDYCVAAALEEAPFAGVRRGMTEQAELEVELAALEKRSPRLPRNDAERDKALREQAGWGWMTDARKPLDAALLVRVTDAAARIAMRGDPSPLPADAGTVVDLNAMDAETVAPEPAATLQSSPAPADDPLLAEADRLEALADATGPPTAAAPRDYGQVARAWLVSGQRLAADCPFPSASLSAVAREGDLAFVDVGRVWAPLAGVGETWVMQRAAGGWRRIARRRTWIS